MSITESQKQLVIDSFAKVTPIANEAAELFYNRLSEVAPETKALFQTTDMKLQGMKLMQTLGIAVKSLHNLEYLIPVLRELGKRHVTYGVNKEHFNVAGGALLWTLEQELGDAFTPEVEEAWARVYNIVASLSTGVYQQVKISDSLN